MVDLLPEADPLMELPAYSVSELNEAIGVLLERGFAPRFLVDGAVVKPVLKKGHLWFSLSDGDASIQAVAWASTVSRLSFRPNDGDGVRVVGKLNFWGARASLSVQALDIRPSLSTVLRRFEQVKQQLESEGLLDPALRRPLPQRPGCIAILTSVPSSALADLLRTAQQRWPACALRVVAIPVQGDVEARICGVLDQLENQWQALGIEALLIARGGGSREDLSVFDGEQLARALLRCPVPVVSGIGHEDDVTIADLAADYRAATPTAAMVALLPDREQEQRILEERGRHWRSTIQQRLLRIQRDLDPKLRRQQLHGLVQRTLEKRQWQLQGQRQLLAALSPERLLQRGYCLLRSSEGALLRDGSKLKSGDAVKAQLHQGVLSLTVQAWQPETSEVS